MKPNWLRFAHYLRTNFRLGNVLLNQVGGIRSGSSVSLYSLCYLPISPGQRFIVQHLLNGSQQLALGAVYCIQLESHAKFDQSCCIVQLIAEEGHHNHRHAVEETFCERIVASVSDRQIDLFQHSGLRQKRLAPLIRVQFQIVATMSF